MTDLPDLGEDYAGRIALRALEMIIGFFPADDSRHGIVDVDRAIDGLAYTMALLANQSGDNDTPAQRRKMADFVRKAVLFRLKQMAEATEAGDLAEWDLAIPVGPKH